jgi:8-oxo-dGTP pyrophosphatase MutT (NUDIX family)
MSRIRAWESLRTESAYDCRLFRVLRRLSRSPWTHDVHDFYILEMPDWVNIVPVTPEGEVVLVRQYRHGVADITLEVPAGMVDPTDPEPRVAARREMREETGYDSEIIEPLGVTHPNPALQDNRCHTFLARNVVRRGAPQNDRTEHTEPVLVPRARVADLIRQGTITHALAIVAVQWFLLAQEDL